MEGTDQEENTFGCCRITRTNLAKYQNSGRGNRFASAASVRVSGVVQGGGRFPRGCRECAGARTGQCVGS